MNLKVPNVVVGLLLSPEFLLLLHYAIVIAIAEAATTASRLTRSFVKTAVFQNYMSFITFGYTFPTVFADNFLPLDLQQNEEKKL